MAAWAVVLAAGRGERLAEHTGGRAKQFLPFGDIPLYFASVQCFARVARIAGVVLVFPASRLQEGRDETLLLAGKESGMPALRFACGAEQRQDSVYSGLAQIPANCCHILIHDAARPFASPLLINALLDSLESGSRATIPVLPVTDTIKTISQENTVTATLKRSELVAVQTPQAFDLKTLFAAHEHARLHALRVTDDASMVEAMGDSAVMTIPGEAANVKITCPADLPLLEQPCPVPLPVTGFGYDVHKYGPGNPCKLGGVLIAGAPEVIAHSDGDVLLHALVDAILGCMGKGDIGQHFPDTDASFAGMESGVFVREAMHLADREGLVLHHADITIIAQVPRLGPHRQQIQKTVAGLLRLPTAQVNIKATTEEGLGFTGKKQGIKAVALVSGLLRHHK